METEVAFLVVGKKGYEVLSSFVKSGEINFISYVVSARDKGVENDFYDEVKRLCLGNGIRFYDRLDKFPFHQKNIYIFCVGWKWMVQQENNVIVFHDSLLPRYRGFSPLVNMLINGEPTIGVTALEASSEYDKGKIISAESVEITYPIKIREAIDLLVPIYFNLVFDVWSKIKGSKLSSTPQIENGATYSLWRDESDYRIDWSESAEFIARFCDAVGSPYKMAKSSINGRAVRINHVKPIEDLVVENRRKHLGKIIFFNSKNPVVVCGSGLLEITDMHWDDDKEFPKIPFRSRFI